MWCQSKDFSEKKFKIINFYPNLVEKSNCYRVPKEFKVPSKMLRNWCRQKETIKQTMYRTARGRVQRKCVAPFAQLEEELYQWVMDNRDEGHIVDGHAIKSQARAIAARDKIDHFRCSSGWLVRFLRRNKLRFRRITSSGRELPKNATETITTFISSCSNQVINNVDRSAIFNFDETCVYLDSFSEYIL